MPKCLSVGGREEEEEEEEEEGEEKELLWRSSHLIPDIISLSERSLGTAPTQVRDDPSSTLEGLEEDE